jgi:hypothetical protein
MNLSVAMELAFHISMYVTTLMTVVTILMKRVAVSKHLFFFYFYIVATQVLPK